MTNLADVNPYAPSRLTTDIALTPTVNPSNVRIGTAYLLVVTLSSVIFSGSVFGVAVGVFVIITAGGVLPIGMVGIGITGLIYGAIIAAISGVPTVLAILCLSAPVVSLRRGWKPRQVRYFAAVCGFFSGAIPLIVLGGLEPASLLGSLVPAAFGCAGTLTSAHLLTRAAKVPNSGVAADTHTPVAQTQQDLT